MNTSDGPPVRITGRLDLYAAALSTLCLIHCMALPLFATLLPVVGQLSENPMVHRILVLLAAPATLWIVWQSLLAERQSVFIVAALSGLLLLSLAAFNDTVAAFEQPITVAGALLLGAAHIWHWARHRTAAGRLRSACIANERSRG